ATAPVGSIPSERTSRSGCRRRARWEGSRPASASAVPSSWRTRRRTSAYASTARAVRFTTCRTPSSITGSFPSVSRRRSCSRDVVREGRLRRTSSYATVASWALWLTFVATTAARSERRPIGLASRSTLCVSSTNAGVGRRSATSAAWHAASPCSPCSAATCARACPRETRTTRSRAQNRRRDRLGRHPHPQPPRHSRWPRPAALRGRPPRLVGRRPRHLPRRLRPRPRARRPGRAPVVRLAARPQPRRPPRRAPRRRRLQPPPRPARGPAERGRGERPLLPAPRARPRDPLRAGRRRGASGGPRTPPPALVLPARLLDRLVGGDERARPPPPAEGRRSPPLALPPACLPPSLPAAGRAGSGARARRVRAPRGARLPARPPALGAGARAAGPDGGRRVSEPHVSVVIPVFNAGDYLARALDSVARQTYRDFETVIVDDGSTDRRTLAILEAAAREPGVTVHRTPNGGPSRARNLGVERARGAYVLPLDADDYLASTFLAKTVPLLDADPALGVVYTWVALVGGHHGVWRTGGFSVTDLLSRCTIHVTSLYRRKIWEDVGGYDPRFVESCEDWDFWLGAAKRGWTGRCVPEVPAYYRRIPPRRALGSVLEAVLAQEGASAAEVVALDSGSRDGTLALLARHPVRVEHLARFTYGAALNRGAALARGALVVYLSAHCRPLGRDWLVRLLAPFTDPQVVASFGRQVPVPGINPIEALTTARNFPHAPPPGVPFSTANAAVRP